MLSVSIFNVARYLTDSLRGPVLAHYDEADRPSPPKGDTQYLTRGPIDTLSIYCLSERLEHFKNLMGLSRFLFFKMFYLTG